MKDNKITIKQVGYTYVFQVETMLRPQHLEELRQQLRTQLKEGCVVLPANVRLASIQPHLEAFAG